MAAGRTSCCTMKEFNNTQSLEGMDRTEHVTEDMMRHFVMAEVTEEAMTVLASTSSNEYTSITAEQNLRIIYLTIGTLGLLGNLLVILVIGRTKVMLRIMTNKYILNQSVCDLTVAVILIFSSIFEDTGRHLAGAGDELYCRLWLTKMPLWGTLVSSTYNLVAMTIERYLAVVHPIWHKMSFTNFKFNMTIIIVWVVGIGYNTAYMVPSTQIQNGACNLYAVWPDFIPQKNVGVFTIVFQFFIPLLIQAFCYISMAWSLKKRIYPTGNLLMKRARKNILKTLCLISISFILCWIWNQVFFLLFNFGFDGVNFQSPFYHFTVVAVLLSCCINPFIYALKYEQFQNALRSVFYRDIMVAPSTSTASNPGPHSQNIFVVRQF